MKNSPILLTLFACFAFATSVFGQAGLERQVISLCGSTLQTASGATLDFTFGESMVTEKNNGLASLSQGFHQTNAALRTLAAPSFQQHAQFQVQIFPNPAQDFLQVQTDTPFLAALFDLNGRQVLPQTTIQHTVQFDLTSIGSGTYFLKAMGLEGKSLQSFKVQIAR
jgi:hypothetical protein